MRIEVRNLKAYALCFTLSSFAWVPPAKLFAKFSRRAQINSLFNSGVLELLLVSPWILDFWMFSRYWILE